MKKNIKHIFAVIAIAATGFGIYYYATSDSGNGGASTVSDQPKDTTAVAAPDSLKIDSIKH